MIAEARSGAPFSSVGMWDRGSVLQGCSFHLPGYNVLPNDVTSQSFTASVGGHLWTGTHRLASWGQAAGGVWLPPLSGVGFGRQVGAGCRSFHSERTVLVCIVCGTCRL